MTKLQLKPKKYNFFLSQIKKKLIVCQSFALNKVAKENA